MVISMHALILTLHVNVRFHFYQCGRTAMSRARANGHSAIVDLLTANGAVIDSDDDVDGDDDDEDDD